MAATSTSTYATKEDMIAFETKVKLEAFREISCLTIINKL